ncbi:hypothetical protein SAMN02799630_01873 [Paenibacillus sp. UNCCL117]|uniref:hypothetical protein n=1 Tax=unclassified Paenibacillus TaxID=185978 RepID=UPI000884369B|nr:MULTISPECIES: hypothetical protein [unclassified Paenibacillus]SDC96466.1 hypothetical protein SAMN04488602_104362 [Paenibacillus sp. cl123]SFW30305.1 hypothetical protein SAMN02799630_01873 [Paenibacillus sp. UNCCL117]
MINNTLNISGVLPHLTASAGIDGARSETGIGAVMPWANRLWFITYVAHKAGTGTGTGLFEVNDKFEMVKRPESVVGTYANRIIHSKSNQLMIGPHFIDTDGNVRTAEELVDHRLTASMPHLTNPDDMLYVLTMEGLLFEVNVHTLKAKLLFDLLKELKVSPDCWPHFKGGWTKDGRLVVANNTYDEREYAGRKSDGRLAEWDGRTWTILEENPYCEVASSGKSPLFATGFDKASAILRVFTHGQWTKYRLPKGTQAMDHMWFTEWPRIREVETERLLMNFHGLFYELSHTAYGGKVWGIRPVCTHLRMVPDFCSWRGLLVLAGNQVTPIFDTNLLAGEPQSNLWFGKTDDLWQFGKPKGWGGPWWEDDVKANEPSDPYLMTGFEHKVLHLAHEAEEEVSFVIEVDFLGNGSWKRYKDIRVAAKGYEHHEFPSGFSAHWVRIIPGSDCTASAHFIYS